MMLLSWGSLFSRSSTLILTGFLEVRSKAATRSGRSRPPAPRPGLTSRYAGGDARVLNESFRNSWDLERTWKKRRKQGGEERSVG